MTGRDEVKNESAEKPLKASACSADLDERLDSDPELRRRLCGDDDGPKAWDFELGYGDGGE